MFKEDVMPILGYNEPSRNISKAGEGRESREFDTVTDEAFQMLRDVGVNLVCSAHYERDDFTEIMELAEKYNIGMLVYDERITEETTESELTGYFSDYEKYSCMKGIYVVDEPFSKSYGQQHYNKGANIEDFAKRASLINSYHNMFGYVNMNPMDFFLFDPNAGSYITDDGYNWTVFWEKYKESYDAFETCYKEYLETYADTYHPKMISWDYYVFDQKAIRGTPKSFKEYFRNLSIVREVAQEHNIAFWGFVQAGSNWNDSNFEMEIGLNPDKTPTQGELYWNVNTYLAYGAKGIEYFPLFQPFYFAYTEGGTWDFDRNGLIGANGSKTSWYNSAKNMNKWIAAIDHILMNAANKQVLVVGDLAQEQTQITACSYEELQTITAEAGAVVGVFEYQGAKAYYVVNYNTESEQSVTLTFESEQTYSGFLQSTTEDDGAKKISGSNQKDISLLLEAGGAALVVEQRKELIK